MAKSGHTGVDTVPYLGNNSLYQVLIDPPHPDLKWPPCVHRRPACLTRKLQFDFEQHQPFKKAFLAPTRLH